ncbi:MAG: hypothetical protein MZV70_73305 [Desulfobacterales bacterium]|nr:hypothetical protein [Desulfobacterales bacterium]
MKASAAFASSLSSSASSPCLDILSPAFMASSVGIGLPGSSWEGLVVRTRKGTVTRKGQQ